jgi:hypothetical protein
VCERERERERESIGRRQARQKEDEMHVQRPTNQESTGGADIAVREQERESLPLS